MAQNIYKSQVVRDLKQMRLMSRAGSCLLYIIDALVSSKLVDMIEPKSEAYSREAETPVIIVHNHW